jgi:ABC-2 type transport system permease protein
MLLRNVFTKALWDSRRGLLGWTIAVVAVGSMYAAFWPTVQSPEMARALESYPKGFLEALNYDDLTTAAGYLSGSVFGLLGPLLLAVFAIAAGTHAIAGDEEAGTLDLVLAHPVSRRRLALQRFASVVVSIGVICFGLWLAMLALTGPAKFDGITAGEFAAVAVQLWLFGVCLAALAFALGAATGSRAIALWVSAAIAVLAYLANGVFPQLEALSWTRNISPFHWYLGGDPLTNGLQVSGPLLLLAAAAALVLLGTAAFDRRDVGV